MQISGFILSDTAFEPLHPISSAVQKAKYESFLTPLYKFNKKSTTYSVVDCLCFYHIFAEIRKLRIKNSKVGKNTKLLRFFLCFCTDIYIKTFFFGSFIPFIL